MDAAAPDPRPKIVTIVGWVWLLGASMRVVAGLLGIWVLEVGGLDRGLPLLGIRSEDLRLRGSVPFLAAQAVIAAAVAWAAFDLLRMKRWAWTAIQAVAALGILGSWAVGAWVYASALREVHAARIEPQDLRLITAAGVVIGLLGSAFFGTTIFLLRRPSVRRAFEPASLTPAP
jgi:hypothetical protein